MEKDRVNRLAVILNDHENEILEDWLKLQRTASTRRPDPISDAELRAQCHEFLATFRRSVDSAGGGDISSQHWDPVRGILTEISRAHARQGFSPSETATFVFSLKQPLFRAFERERAKLGGDLVTDLWEVTKILDRLGLFSTEVYQKSRDEIIHRQQRELLELSTPVVKLWHGILAVPLIGTLDSERTQVVMESLLQTIVNTGAGIAIIDITGVPTVDTLVAQHLLKTVAAARLMGAECIISGIRPQIAATIVHLGVDLNSVVTKATLADAFRLALRRTGQTVLAGQETAREARVGTNSDS